MDSGVSGLWRLTVRSEFSAAHALRHYQGKCERLHGHNFAVELTVEGSQLAADTGMLLDFSILKGILRQILEQLDHCVLNDLAPFNADLNPSSELLAWHIGQCAIAALRDLPEGAHARVYAVSVSEKGAQSALWFAPA